MTFTLYLPPLLPSQFVLSPPSRVRVAAASSDGTMTFTLELAEFSSSAVVKETKTTSGLSEIAPKSAGKRGQASKAERKLMFSFCFYSMTF